MREIKFRAWDSAKQKMGKPWSLNRQLCLPPKEDEHWLDRFPSHILFLQFTGLKDKNGVEIYEGDIRKGKYYFESEEQTSYQVMKWDEKNACFFWEGKSIPDFIEVEVIGNIYQNPELLK